jgi:hypothetical protein
MGVSQAFRIIYVVLVFQIETGYQRHNMRKKFRLFTGITKIRFQTAERFKTLDNSLGGLVPKQRTSAIGANAD